jgi:GNAT superfamily N-acetyltransferase
MPNIFFEMLPKEWSKELMPCWLESKSLIEVFGIVKEDQLLGGGLVFTEYTSENDSYPEVAQGYFDQGLLYLGFIWIDENYRGLNLGSFWLNEIQEMFPNKGFWLTIVDRSLGDFYEKNGFILDQRLELESGDEWVYCKNQLS